MEYSVWSKNIEGKQIWQRKSKTFLQTTNQHDTELPLLLESDRPTNIFLQYHNHYLIWWYDKELQQHQPSSFSRVHHGSCTWIHRLDVVCPGCRWPHRWFNMFQLFFIDKKPRDITQHRHFQKMSEMYTKEFSYRNMVSATRKSTRA